jgi:hypothetical protein
MDFLSANWVWLLLGLAVVWMLMSRGGRSCGFGGPRSGRSTDAKASAGDGESRDDRGAADGNESATPRSRDSEHVAHSRRRGC